jgi:hypothetical protein
MKHVYTFFSKVGLLLAFGLLGITSFAQTSPCGPIVENFDNTGGTMAGFTSSTVNSTATGFTYNPGGGDGYLQRCNISTGGVVYELNTPTYRTLPTQTSVGYGFELSGAVKVSRVIVLLQYIDATGAITTVEVANFVPTYSNPGSSGLAVECRSVSINTYAGFDPGEAYRFIFQLTASSASNANQCITFDDFRTTGAGAQAPLPVTFTNISARKAGSGVNIFWNVAGEKDVLRYEIERSINGRDFTKIGEVAANSNSGYLFADNQPINGVSFYRVRNVDIDGKFTYTSVARVNLSKIIALKAFPQPANNTLTIEHGSVNGKGMLSLSTADGRTVFQSDIKPDVNQTVINLSAYRPGLYIVRFDNGSGEVESIKVLKQ